MAEKSLTIERAMSDFKRAYEAKRKLIDREREDFLYALGSQWSHEEEAKLKEAGMKAFTDNRIAPNLYLLTGLERQNRSDFKAFPEGEEDGLKAEIASALFKNSIKVSDFSFKSSEQFKDGVTCGESHLELYLDYTENLLNGKPCWHKVDGNCIFPEPGFREYDFNDARYVYKIKLDLSREDLTALFPKKKGKIKKLESGKIDFKAFPGGIEAHRQPRDYGKEGEAGRDKKGEDGCFDLLERYYKKWVEKAFVGDKQTGEIKEAESLEKAEGFISAYQDGIAQEQAAYQEAVRQFQLSQMPPEAMVTLGGEPEAIPPPMVDEMGQPLPPMAPPVEPTPRDPERFILIERSVPEIWCYSMIPGLDEPLADEVAWFYPKWKSYPFIPYFARFSTAPLTGDDRHLLIQGVVHGVKGAQEKHNKSEMLMLRHLNASTNSGWLTEEDSWVDPDAARDHGSSPAVNLEYKSGKPKPERIYPMQLSQGHAQISADAAESIKSQLGINADLLAAQDGGSSSSGRAIALRQRQGLLMVQEFFDNLTRTRTIAGKFLLTQLGEIYDTESAKKVLGDAFLRKNFPPLMLMNPATGQQEPMAGPDGKPMAYDKEMAELAIAEVLAGDLGTYDVSVGEAVSSETIRLANAEEVKQIAQTYPGLIPPDILVEESQLPQSTKTRVMNAIKQAQAAAVRAAPPPVDPAEVAA